MIVIHKSNGGFAFWDKEKQKVIQMFQDEHMSLDAIGQLYGCYGSTIKNHLERWGEYHKHERYNAIYKVNQHFFDEIYTEEKAYFTGLLLADGHVSLRNVIMLTMQDLDIIEKYKNALGASHEINVDKYGNYYLNICSRQLSNALRRIGFTNRKSYNIDFEQVLSNIPQRLLHHFVRGMFDGDGSIRKYEYSYLTKPQYHLGYTGLPSVVEFIKRYFGMNTKTVHESDITDTCVTSNRSKIIEIYNLLYKDATVYINRKHDEFLSIIQ